MRGVGRRAIGVGLAVLLVAGVVLSIASCGGGSVDPPSDSAAALVPADATSYVHVTTDRRGWERLQKALKELPAISALIPSGFIRPPTWLGKQAAVASTPSGRQVLLEVGKKKEAEAFARSNGAVIDRGYVVLGRRPVPAGRSLAGRAQFTALRKELPDDRAAEAYLAESAVPPELTVITGPPTADAAMLSIGASGDQARVVLRSVHGPPRAQARACERPRTGSPQLVSTAPSDTAGYLEVGRADCLLAALDAPRLRQVARVLRRRGGVDLGRQLLPLLDGQAAINAANLDSGPALTLVADGVPREKGLSLLGRLQPALLALLGPRQLVQAPVFEATQAGGVSALTASLAPALQVSYAAFGGKIVLSTALAGIEAATRKGGLAQSGAYQKVLGTPPGNASFVLFLDLEQLLALQEQVGFAANRRVMAVRDDLQKLREAGAYLAPRGETQTQGELRFTIP